MAYPEYIKEKARWMRTERRMTLDEIAERLAINKTTVWYWIKDIDVVPESREPSSPMQIAKRRKASAANRAKHAALRKAAYERGRIEYDELIEVPGFRDFICMYIGEGYKRNRNRVSIGNSDPRVISLADYWLKRLSPEKSVHYSVQYHADQDLESLKRFWAFRVGVEPDKIVLQRKSNSGQLAGRKWRSRWGVLSVTVHDTYLRSRLEAWIDRVNESWLDSFAPGV